MKLGLDQMRALCSASGHPEKQFRSIHIAGTNGKGSVATKIAKGLQASRYRVGLFTSPHLSTFRERIQINGEMILEDELEKILKRIIHLPGTFFELTTLAAFTYFAEKKVDFAVVEVGLGGRLDATNVLLPTLSAITSISLEHTEFLGNTLEEIAGEKAGIIKPDIPVVIGPRAAIIKAPQAIYVHGNFTTVDQENSAIAKRAMEYLGLRKEVIVEALKIRPANRMEKVGDAILDAAHNPDAFQRYFQEDARRPLNLVLGMSKSKDLEGCLEIAAKNGSFIHLVEAPNGRCAPSRTLKKILLAKGFPENRMQEFKTIAEAVHASMRKGETAVIGSFFIMSQARNALGIKEPVDPIEMNERI